MYLALRDLGRGMKRFLLIGIVIGLVAVLTTILSGLATGLVTDGISGLRSLSLTHLALQPGAQATFSRSTLDEQALQPFLDTPGIEVSPLGVSFLNARSTNGGESLDLAVFGVAPDSFLLTRPEAREAIDGPPGLVLSEELRKQGVEVGDTYSIGGSDLELPVLGFTFGGTYGHAPIAYVSLDTWRQINYGNADDDRFSAIAIRDTGGADLSAAATAAGVDVLTKEAAYQGSPGFAAETATMDLIRGFLLVISALVIGAFFTVLTVQRTRQIGLLKAMGASNGYILRDGIGQMTVLVLAATVIGTVVGTGLVALVARGDAPVELDPRSIVVSGLSLVIAGVLGSAVAMRRITKVEPIIALGAEG